MNFFLQLLGVMSFEINQTSDDRYVIFVLLVIYEKVE